MESSLNVLTLNCWGVRVPLWGAKWIDERLDAIADLAINGNYDVVAFQEVWDMADYMKLSSKITAKLPHAHYFHCSGFLGSGLCVFSRYPIVETMYHNFPLNGHAHKLRHCDWYAAKGCALIVLKANDLTVNVYTTHIHARHDLRSPYDEYTEVRASQAFSFSQFVRHTSSSCDVVIATGDFNTRPTCVGYGILRSNGVLNDAWLAVDTEGPHAMTSDLAENCFTADWITDLMPDGQRIDFVFYRANDQTSVRVESCKVLIDKIPGTDMDYSDHSGLEARMFIKRDVTAWQEPRLDPKARQENIKDVVKVIDKGSARATHNKQFYFVTMLLALMVLLICREACVGDGGGSLHAVLEVTQVVMAIISGGSFWLWFVVSRCDENGYLSMKTQLEDIGRGSALANGKKHI